MLYGKGRLGNNVMNALETVDLSCPYCGEAVQLLVDCSEGEQQYTEDCQVCCQPMVVSVYLPDDDAPRVLLYREDEIA